ncbi:MAG: hypothetical protein JXA73_23205, partial [Acidobacteria bacterium]|nr:hypothetical protein [Acidobacteriota bacterium]
RHVGANRRSGINISYTWDLLRVAAEAATPTGRTADYRGGASGMSKSSAAIEILTAFDNLESRIRNPPK